MKGPIILQSIILLMSLVNNAYSMTIDMGQYLLDEKKVGTKARYVYSDFNKDTQKTLENATIDFNLGIYQINYE